MIICSSCKAQFTIISGFGGQQIRYCPSCRAPISEKDLYQNSSLSFIEDSSIVEEFTPESVQFSIGPYKALKSIGKGGMGEVFLVYDPTCGRKIALKQIRPDLVSHVNLHQRFLREARITSQLTHPSIIPIYNIQSQEGLIYYTMPYVEGKTLRQILAEARESEKKGKKGDHGSSIPSLIRIFYNICQAIAYAHSKNVIHRDIKPNNVIVGQYGEVLILDWGLAKLFKNQDLAEEQEDVLEETGLEETQVGKVVGTVTYMAPERAQGQPANFQTEIYALGVILYQILTLHHPFHRTSLQEFRKNMANEVLYPPAEMAPYRDVPPILSRIVCKCLSSLNERYHSVNELIHDLETYMEGRSEWFSISHLNIAKKEDWEFQENVLIAEHIAITRSAEVSEWVSLMISRNSFTGNIKLETEVKIGSTGHGLGFLLSVPESAERSQPNTGYCLWIASDLTKNTKLLRTTVEVLFAPEVFLQRGVSYTVRIEKIENSIYLYLNDQLQISYISHFPLTGSHIGLLSRDADFELSPIAVSVGSESITVNCLALPDAFLAHKDFLTALTEYRRISYSFPGTAESREAMFRAGVTLLEEACDLKDPVTSMKKRDEALEEFGKLHDTPGAPLEYLGKALVYQNLGEYTEESKCFELAFRRYPHHPLLNVLQEQLVHRTHESSRINRIATYQFLLIILRFLPKAARTNHTTKLMNSLKKHWEPLYFINEISSSEPEALQNLNFSNVLAFWLVRLDYLIDIIEVCLYTPHPNFTVIANSLFALIELDAWHIAKAKLPTHANRELDLVRLAIQSREQPTLEVIDRLAAMTTKMEKQELRLILFLMNQALIDHKPAIVEEIYQRIEKHLIDLDNNAILEIDSLRIWAYLLNDQWEQAGTLLHRYPIEQLTHESSLLYFLYGCWLYVTEGQEIALIHFKALLEVPYPRSWMLFSHFINAPHAELEQWFQKAFVWEKKQFYRQGALYYHCANEKDSERKYELLAKRVSTN